MSENNFSVSICVYGGDNPKWFEAAVESILNQTVKPTEVVLVVDGPIPDDLNSIIKKYECRGIFNVVRFDENQGHGNARRAGISACKNELVALMDADDISAPFRFEKQLSVFKNDENLDIVGGNITEFIDYPENVVARRDVPSTDSEIKKYMKKRCPMNQVTVMFKKNSISQVGGYVDWYCDEDYYLWLRMCLADMKFANLTDVLVNVRVGKEMYQRRGGVKYFKSEAKLQNFMLKSGIIGISTYALNVSKRFIVQVMLPNTVRGWVFKKFARKRV